jgi:acylphosphatase
MSKVARQFIVRGEVQGVGYRFFAQRAAAAHQVVGYVKNMPDGSVESLAEGPLQSVEAFKNDLAAGPRHARITQVEEKVVEPTGRYMSFRVER